jgi:hypothetical protein
MADQVADAFFNRADAHIGLSNQQMKSASRPVVSASMMYATARFNAWSAFIDHASAEGLALDRQEVIDYFVGQFRLMLEENVDDHIRNFPRYMEESAVRKQDTPE